MNAQVLNNMGKHKSHNEKYSLLILITLFFIFNLIFIFYQENIWWDAAVYTGMGKYIYSAGNSGLFESVRPVVWPLILGLLWKTGIDIIFFGKLASLFFSLGVLIMTFLIAKEIFDKKVALLSVLLLALAPTFFFFSKIMLAGIVSTFFVLVAVYLFLRKSYFFSGIFFGLGFMTRFLQLFAFIAVVILFLIYNKRDRVINFLKLLVGFFIPVFPYLMSNYILYNNIFYPFMLQALLTKVTGWIWFEPFWFYFIEMFKENFLYIFAVFGLFYLFKKKIDFGKLTIVYLFFTFFLFFTLTKHKEMRFLLVLLPYLSIITAFGLIRSFERLNQKNIKIPLFYILIIFIFQASLSIYANEKTEFEKENRFIEFQSYLNDASGNIWISNPVYAAYSDKKIGELVYYPVFNADKINSLNSKLGKADVVLLDTCDLLCNPDDTECQKRKENFLNNIRNKFEIDFNNKYGNCEQFIFSKR
ncbi:MAG: glycosyltransferase family 39 protein [Candidatus Woesearchaeota archaeon]